MLIQRDGRIDMIGEMSGQGSGSLVIFKPNSNSGLQNDMIQFDVGGAGRGKIVSASSGSGVPQFSSYSDRRLKTNITDYTGGYEKIKAIKVRSYDEVSSDSTKEIIGETPATGVVGYIADEFQTVFPEGTVGAKDAVVTQADLNAGLYEGKSVGDKIAMYEALTGQSALQPLRDLIDGPQAPNMTTPDLVSEVKNKIELQKQQIAAAPKMYPMFYERANKGKFIKVKTKLGRTRKTKLL
jgi:hypothetical protein